MKRLVYSSSEVSESGFLFEAGKKAYFYKSNLSNITDKIARKFINAVCDERGVGDKIRQSALYDSATLDDFKRRISNAVLEEHDTGKIKYFTIRGKYFTLNFPEEDFEQDVIVIE